MEDLEKLRRILLSREQDALESIERRLSNVPTDAEDLARLLPDAIRSGGDNAERLTSALQKPVSDCLQEAARTDPKPLVDALFPVIGPAIRKAITESLREFTSTINQAIEHSVSPKGLRWRLESMRTGVPFSEIVLQNTLRYRVERVFLVHGSSGLLIEDAAAEGAGGMDSDAVSAMLTAIESFVRDSFMEGQPGGQLDSVDLGEYTLMIVHGPHAVLACAVRGAPPAELRRRMHEVTEEVHSEFGAALEGFSGDKISLVGIETYLQKCLLQEAAESAEADAETEDDTGLGLGWWLLLAVLVVGALGWWLASFWQAQQVQAARAEIEAMPGVVITRIERVDGQAVLHGLRDPVSDDPAERLRALADGSAAAGMPFLADAYRLELKPYYSLDPEIILRRAEATLNPPDGVRLSIEDGALVLAGEQPLGWDPDFESLRRLPGIEAVETRWNKAPEIESAPPPPEPVADEPAPVAPDNRLADAWREAQILAAALGAQQVFFDFGVGLWGNAEGTLDRAARLARRLLAMDAELGLDLRLELIGYTDAVGTELVNDVLRKTRAEVVRDALVERGVPEERIRLREGRAATSEGRDPEWRRVDFNPKLSPPAGISD